MSHHHHQKQHPIHYASESSPFGGLTAEEFYAKHQVLHHDSFFRTSDGFHLHTHSWRPAASAATPLKGLVAMLHGYASETGWIFALTATAIARCGFLACALDLRGHGRSDGRRGHLSRIAPAVDDCVRFFDSVRKDLPADLPAFLYGESLGGAMAALIAVEQKGRWSGLVLNGAMCGVSRRFKPPWPLEELLPVAAFVMPSWRVVVTRSLVSKSYKLKWKRELVRRSPQAQPSEHPPAATAAELLRVCKEVGRRCGELELPLLVVHGGEDAICDRESAQKVFDIARSEDKTIRIIPDAWHQLIGDSEENVELGFGLIFSWLDARAKNKKYTTTTLSN